MLMEEEACARAKLIQALSDLGFSVLETADEEDALSALTERPDVRVLVADIDRQDGAGLEMVRHLHDRCPALGLIIISQQVRHLRPSDVPGEGCFVPKPIPLNTLAAELAAAVPAPL
jgi:DNA-binding NtrC family response regulator